MKKLLAIMVVMFYSISAWAISTDCSATKNKTLPKDTKVFFYQRIKDKKVFYIPVLVLKDGKLSSIGKMLMPTEVTMFNLQDDKPIKVHFKNSYNPMEDACQSIGEAKLIGAKPSSAQLYANQTMAKEFNFNSDKADQARFATTIKDPCKPGQKNYDKNGVAVCNADKLIATSELIKQKQYWQSKQYRHDVGLSINVWDEKNNKFKQLVEDCTLCSD